MTAEIENKLAKELNNKVFAHFHIGKVFSEWQVSVDWYLVQDGLIYSLRGKEKYKSGDSIFDTQLQCEMIGDYDENMDYVRFSESYSFKQIIRKFHLGIMLNK